MIIVGCGKAKLAVAAKARDLYTGSLFRAARRYAEQSRQPWLILSAVHGVVAPDTFLRPYNQKLELRGDALIRWARLAADEIVRRRQYPDERVEILAGAGYAVPLARELIEQGVESFQPLAGLSLGYRLQRLTVLAEDAARSSDLGGLISCPGERREHGD